MTAGPVPGTKLLAGRCPYCQRDVFSVRDVAAGRVVVLDRTPKAGQLVTGPLRPPGAVSGWDAQGAAAVVNPDAVAPQVVSEVYEAHARTCHRMAAATGATVPQRPESGTCRGCGAPMLWIRTVEGKRVPLDPEAQEGPEHGGGGPPAGRLLVRGYDLHGAVRAITVPRPDAQPDLFPAKEAAPIRVFVSHFATCPRRDDFKRERPGASPRTRRT